jgi:hypothetical protein
MPPKRKKKHANANQKQLNINPAQVVVLKLLKLVDVIILSVKTHIFRVNVELNGVGFATNSSSSLKDVIILHINLTHNTGFVPSYTM